MSSQLPQTPDAEAGARRQSDSAANTSTQICAICLDSITPKNKCYAVNCMHQFCYDCITQWLQSKKECPLCKRHLVGIMYDIESNDSYKLKHFDDNGVNEESDMEDDDMELSGIAERDEESESDADAEIRASPVANVTPKLLSLFGHRSPSIRLFVQQYGLFEHQIPERTTCLQWRRFCYEYNLYAHPHGAPRMDPHRSIDFYRRNAALLGELKRWTHRELLALSNVVDVVITDQQIQNVLEGVEHCNIASDEFLFFVPPLEPKTQHFIHELISFACSVQNYSVREYDAVVKYDFRPPENGGAPPRHVTFHDTVQIHREDPQNSDSDELSDDSSDHAVDMESSAATTETSEEEESESEIETIEIESDSDSDFKIDLDFD